MLQFAIIWLVQPTSVTTLMFLLLDLLLKRLSFVALEGCHPRLFTLKGSYGRGGGWLEVGIFAVSTRIGHCNLLHFQCALFEAHNTVIVKFRQLLYFICLALKLGDPMAVVLWCIVQVRLVLVFVIWHILSILSMWRISVVIMWALVLPLLHLDRSIFLDCVVLILGILQVLHRAWGWRDMTSPLLLTLLLVSNDFILMHSHRRFNRAGEAWWQLELLICRLADLPEVLSWSLKCAVSSWHQLLHSIVALGDLGLKFVLLTHDGWRCTNCRFEERRLPLLSGLLQAHELLLGLLVKILIAKRRRLSLLPRCWGINCQQLILMRVWLMICCVNKLVLRGLLEGQTV